MSQLLQGDREATGFERWVAFLILGVPALCCYALTALLVHQRLTDPTAEEDWSSFLLGLLIFGGLALLFTYLMVRVARSSAQAPAFGIVFRSVFGLLALAAGLWSVTAKPEVPVHYTLFFFGFSFAILRSVVVLWRQGLRPFGLASRSSRSAN